MRAHGFPCLDPAMVLLGYRAGALLAALFGTLLAGIPLTTPSALGVIGTVAMTALLAVVYTRPSWSDRSLPLELVDLVAAGLCVGLTGGLRSAFVLYMTAPVLAPAMRRQGVQLAVVMAAAAWIYGSAVAVDGRTADLGRIVGDLALLILVPSLVFVLVASAQPSSDAFAPAATMLETGDVDLLGRLARGLTYKQIADEAALSPESVKVAVARLYRRLGARSRAEAIAIGRERGFLPLAADPTGERQGGGSS
jgi:DNA-binding CsgD family transcriptional regulator